MDQSKGENIAKQRSAEQAEQSRAKQSRVSIGFGLGFGMSIVGRAYWPSSAHPSLEQCVVRPPRRHRCRCFFRGYSANRAHYQCATQTRIWEGFRAECSTTCSLSVSRAVLPRASLQSCSPRHVCVQITSTSTGGSDEGHQEVRQHTPDITRRQSSVASVRRAHLTRLAVVRQREGGGNSGDAYYACAVHAPLSPTTLGNRRRSNLTQPQHRPPVHGTAVAATSWR